MEVIPAIDIRGGRCVRLTQGDYARETVFAEDPAAVARRWQDAGAQRLHVVDLDGARVGRPVNASAVQRVVASAFIPVQLGGGLRDLGVIQRYAEMGVDRFVLGTVAVKDQTTLLNALALFPDRIVVAIDARDGIVASEGWRESAGVPAADLLRQLAETGVTRFVYTDIARDGTLTEPNFAAVEALAGEAGKLSGGGPDASLTYSGGVTSVDHLLRLARLGLEGAIVGTALYAGTIDLAEALAAVMAA
ncbi:MAG: 1-(5-phosphoribosyl)-5-[(5-phosphoribosylamino)methylideneamino]imidazole-4-carboxamide isomerase [Chloroflexi bacterium]|nr:1-(5-phosphoribosyl)-5-[(5-phosphoribosylamino)methylideneamino]imidazole-4-carboxamide isomerase [Chloroflexota bacterium]